MRINCPHCGQLTVLGAAELPVETENQEITAGELTEALAGRLKLPRISVFYQIGLLLVAIFMVLLPVVYLGFAVLLAWCTYWYASNAKLILGSFDEGIHMSFIRLITYLGPVLGGVIGVFFMFKPILARAPKSAEPLELNPSQHPRVYQLIEHLCRALRVPMPKQIHLISDTNAYAGFRRGWRSMLGNDLAMGIGLPLVAGMNTRQLTEVISHELGHCTQWLAMRLYAVIESINRWFLRVVYQQDSWDVAFEDWCRSGEKTRFRSLVVFVRFEVWFTRKILWVLMWLGHAASCFLSRQMEYHADACGMAVVGSDCFESSTLRLRELIVLQSLSYQFLGPIWKKRHQLPDNLPDFLKHFESKLPADFQEKARLTLLNEQAGFFATHPTDVQRIQRARQRGVAGIFTIEKPARLLFNDFEATARILTARHYRRNFLLPVTDHMLKPVEEFLEESLSAQRKPIAIPRH